jgi:putative membrane protein
MILRDRPSPLRLFLVMRGSVLPSIWKSLLATTLLAVAVAFTDGRLWGHKIAIGAVPFTLMGLPLAIFLGFRNNAAYDRYWEGRKQWGELVLRSRSLARQCLSLADAGLALEPGNPDDLRARMMRRAIAYAHALRHRLRRSDATLDVAPWLLAAEWERVRLLPNLPHALMLEMGADLGRSLRERRIDPCLAPSVDATLSAMTGVAAACERIHGTPIPFSYTLLLHRTAYLYCWLLPFGLVDAIGDLHLLRPGCPRRRDRGTVRHLRPRPSARRDLPHHRDRPAHRARRHRPSTSPTAGLLPAQLTHED